MAVAALRTRAQIQGGHEPMEVVQVQAQQPGGCGDVTARDSARFFSQTRAIG